MYSFSGVDFRLVSEVVLTAGGLLASLSLVISGDLADLQFDLGSGTPKRYIDLSKFTNVTDVSSAFSWTSISALHPKMFSFGSNVSSISFGSFCTGGSRTYYAPIDIFKDIIIRTPFDENFKYYGYEDVLFGKSICQKGYHITHINNPILLDEYETNYRFILKTEEACRTLYQFRKELKGYSKLITYSELITRMIFVKPLLNRLFPWVGLHIKSRLTGNKPSVLWFNIYKLLYYIHLDI